MPIIYSAVDIPILNLNDLLTMFIRLHQNFGERTCLFQKRSGCGVVQTQVHLVWVQISNSKHAVNNGYVECRSLLQVSICLAEGTKFSSSDRLIKSGFVGVPEQ
jgi:hypothetical protein